MLRFALVNAVINLQTVAHAAIIAAIFALQT